jgi:hypothetical protein
MANYTGDVAAMKRGAFPAIGPKLGLIENEIEFKTINAGILADADTIQVFDLPIGCMIVSAGMEVTQLVAGAAQMVLDLGTSDDADQFVDGSSASAYDIGTSGSQRAVGVYSQPAPSVTTTAAGCAKILSEANTLDITVQAITGASATLTAGKVRVWALVVDVDDMSG